MSDIISKIQKLLAKAEATEYEAEADAFLAKAQALMTEYAISEAALKAEGKQPRESIAEVNVAMVEKAPAYNARTWLLDSIARAMSCRTLRWPGQNRSVVIGYKSEAEFSAMLYMSIDMQCHSAVLRAMKEAKKEYRVQGRQFRPGVWRRSFVEGYLGRVGRRITERYVRVDETYGTGTSIVLRDRGLEVWDWVKDRYAVKEAKDRKRTVKYDFEAAAQGREAGERADISGGRNTIKHDRKELN